METAQQLALARWSRRSVLKAAGIGAAGFTLAQANFIRSLAQESDEIQDILDITATTERFGIAFLGEGLRANEAGEFDVPFPDTVVAVLMAARAQEVYHLEEFERLGGKARVDTFTVPPEALTTFAVFFQALVDQETRETAAHIAAMTAFSEAGRPDLAKVGFQYAAEEAEHRLLANYTLGVRPANDRAFADHLFTSIDDFYAALEEVGLIDGPGTEITYPGPGEIDDTGVTEKEPGGPDAACNAQATPVADDAAGDEEGEDEATPAS